MTQKDREETLGGVVMMIGLAFVVMGAWQLFGSAVALIILGALLTAAGSHMYKTAGKP